MKNHKCCYTCKKCYGVVGGDYKCSVEHEQTHPEDFCICYDAERPELDSTPIWEKEE